MDVKRYKPRATVHFFTETGNLIARATEDFNNKSGNLIDSDVVSIQTNRDMGADAPTFSVVLTRHRKWHKLVASNDLMGIQMVRPPEKNRSVFIGLVDDVRKTVSMDSGGKPQRTITISGRGVAKAFIQFDIGQVPEAEIIDPNVGWLANNGINFAGSNSDEIIQAVWDNIAKKFVNYKFADGRNLFDIAQTQLSARTGARLKDDLGLINWQSSLWAFIKEVADEPFNEVFWETDGEFPLLIVRPTPFNKADWDALQSYDVTDEEVVAEEIGRSDIETYTLFSVGMKSYFSSQDAFKTTGILPVWYEPYKNKYGIRRLHVETLFSAWAGGADNALASGLELEEYQRDLYNWNITNSSFYNGTLVLRGSARFKVGTRIKFYSQEEDETLEFYVRSVMHSFVNFGSWVTVLGVIRGCVPEKRFDSPVNKHTEYSGIGWGIYDPAAAQNSLYTPTMGINTSSTTFNTKANAVIAKALQLKEQDNIEYKFGGPGILQGYADCSQFTQFVYMSTINIDLGRTTGDQILKGTPIINIDDLAKGDLVFFKGTYASTHVLGVSHVGIYTGNRKFLNLNNGGVLEDLSLIHI